eukprot:Hpha_TRINITY_DN10217_c0_g2::TRINITY_DN10217_c0_g2_i1::g.35231::m.35231
MGYGTIMALRHPLVLFLMAAGMGLVLKGILPVGGNITPSNSKDTGLASQRLLGRRSSRRKRKLVAEEEPDDRQEGPQGGGRWDNWVEPEDVEAGFKDAARRILRRFDAQLLREQRERVTVAGFAKRVEEMRQNEVRARYPHPDPTAPAWSGICWVIQVVDGKVYVRDTGREMCTHRKEKTGKLWYESFFAVRRRVALNLIERAVRSSSTPIPNLEFAHCVGDCPMHTMRNRKEHNYPVFSTTYCSFSNMIPLPQWEPGRSGGPPQLSEVGGWMKEKLAFSEKVLERFESKRPAAVYRGAKVARGCYCNQWGAPPSPAYENCGWQSECKTPRAIKHQQPCGRKLLASISKKHPEEIDYTDTKLSMTAQAKEFQFVVHLEGTCGWADRLSTLLALPMAIVKQVNWCGEWYNLLLRPWEHYIPVKCDLSDVVHQVEKARRNQTALAEMVRRANRYIERAYTPSVVEGYTAELLLSYAKVMGFDKNPLEGPSEGAVPAREYPADYGGLQGTPK